MGTFKHKGVFCLEGDWETDLKGRTTVTPVLELLERSHYPAIRSIRPIGSWITRHAIDIPNTATSTKAARAAVKTKPTQPKN